MRRVIGIGITSSGYSTFNSTTSGTFSDAQREAPHSFPATRHPCVTGVTRPTNHCVAQNARRDAQRGLSGLTIPHQHRAPEHS